MKKNSHQFQNASFSLTIIFSITCLQDNYLPKYFSLTNNQLLVGWPAPKRDRTPQWYFPWLKMKTVTFSYQLQFRSADLKIVTSFIPAVFGWLTSFQKQHISFASNSVFGWLTSFHGHFISQQNSLFNKNSAAVNIYYRHFSCSLNK